MSLVEQIIAALLVLEPDDLITARRYLEWIKIRHRVNHHFYFAAHWAGSRREGMYHWIG